MDLSVAGSRDTLHTRDGCTAECHHIDPRAQAVGGKVQGERSLQPLIVRVYIHDTAYGDEDSILRRSDVTGWCLVACPELSSSNGQGLSGRATQHTRDETR